MILVGKSFGSHLAARFWFWPLLNKVAVRVLNRGAHSRRTGCGDERQRLSGCFGGRLQGGSSGEEDEEGHISRRTKI